jgi:hypothetical protein
MADGKSDTHCGTIVEADQEAVAAGGSQISTAAKPSMPISVSYNLWPNSGDFAAIHLAASIFWLI